jgi:subtilisin family serine protease
VNQVRIENQGNPSPEPARAPRPATPKLDSLDSYQNIKDTLARGAVDGKVPLIVSDLNRRQRRDVKSAASDFLTPQETHNLPGVHGFGACIPTNKLGDFLDSLPCSAGLGLNVDMPWENAVVPTTLFEDSSTGGPATIGPTALDRLSGLDKVRAEGFTGKGAPSAAIIDSGIFPHADLKSHVKDWMDFYQHSPTMVDTVGHGTNVAGIVAGSGQKSDGKIMGVAPDGNLVGLRVGSIQDAIEALHWVVQNKDKDNIRVVNLSLGEAPVVNGRNPISSAVQEAIDAGVYVVVSAGNRDSNHTSVTAPGDVKGALTVGAVNDQGTVQLSDDTLASFSLYGTTFEGVNKPDLVAPGSMIFAPLSPGSSLDQDASAHIGQNYMAMSGTSQAAPMVTGLILDLLQANPNLTNDQLTHILVQSCQHLNGIPDKAQGAGEVQADQAINLALALKTNSTTQAA